MIKGDVVMTEFGLAGVEEYVEGKNTLVIFIFATKTGMVVRLDEITKATRLEAEVYLNSIHWHPIRASYGFSKRDNKYIVTSFNNTDFEVELDLPLNELDFEIAHIMLSEAILVARLLKATK